MKNGLVKEFFREIKQSRNRFISIMLIILLGVGFFVGVKAASPSMKYSADKFFQSNNLMDFRLISEFGFSDADIDAISNIDGVTQVMPAYTSDLLVQAKTSNNVVRVQSLPQNYKESENPINEVNVVEGRLPMKSGECVVDSNQQFENSYKVGDKITVNSSEKDKDIKDVLKTNTYTVVGLVESPQYISYDRGISRVGDGTILYYMMILPQDFAYPKYTEVYVKTIASADEVTAFSEQYKNDIGNLEKPFEKLSIDRIEINKNEILQEAKDKIQKIKDQLAAERKDAEEKFAKAEEEINKGKETIIAKEKELADSEKKLASAAKQIQQSKNKIAQSEKDLAAARVDYNNQIAAAEKDLEQGKRDYEDGLNQYNKAYADFQVQKKQAEEQIAKEKENLAKLKKLIDALEQMYSDIENMPMDEIYNQLDSIMAQIRKANETAPPEYKLTEEQLQQIENAIEGFKQSGNKEQILAALREEINREKAKYNEGLAQIAAAEKQLADAENALAAQKQKLDAAKAKLDAAEAKLNRQKSEGQKKLDKAQKDIDNAKIKLAEAQRAYNQGIKDLANGKKQLEESKIKIVQSEKDLNQAKEEAELKFKEAEGEILQKEKELKDLTLGKWYILNRYDNPGFQSFEDDAERIDRIASIFPLFFLIVAALVCLTTMTRMIEEQRTQIGTLKAIGYKDKRIVAKYFFYALAAALGGSILGIILGLAFLPKLIFNAYHALYMLPNFNVHFSWGIVAIAIFSALLCTCTVTLVVAYREFRTTPATLMRPKAPKKGKRIFLEKVPFVWNRLNFTSKVTARNILRYKSRFIMTILGVAGCTALILAAYGLKDSISVVVPRQYGEIFTFDSMMNLKYEGTLPEKSNIKAILNQDKDFESNILVDQRIMKGSKENGNNEIEIRMFVPEKTNLLPSYVTLKDAKNKDDIQFTSESVVITNKFAKLLGVSVGDTINIFDDNMELHLKVTDIAENYVYNYVYISPELYKDKVGDEAVFNTVLSKFIDEAKNNQEAVAERWLKNYDVLSVVFTSSVIDNFNNIIASLNRVVAVMIICAAALAFVVLYNLTNINVAERLREIATIKVLGFTDKESANYVYRENIVLSVIGILLGLIVGIFLSYFIVSSVEMDIVMFGREIKAMSFLYASGLTIIFTLFVNLVMYRRINNISMVESLKSIE